MVRDFCETQALKFGLKWWVSKSDFYTLTPSFKVRILIPLPNLDSSL